MLHAVDSERGEIPKIIHYVWVGPAPLPPLVLACIASWKKHLPEYTLRFWHEGNAPMNHPYVKAMYEQKKWAFVSDYIRFWALDREGGIYLDTDMEVLRSFDTLRAHSAGFVGRSKTGQIESSIIAAQPGADFIQKALAFYDTDTEYSIKMTSPRVLETAISTSFQANLQVYEYTYFHPCDEGELCTESVLRNAYARHHWAESWVPFARLRKVLRRLGIIKLYKRFRL